MRPAEPEEDASGDVPRKGVAETPVGDRKCASEAPPLPVQSVSFSNVTEECFDSFCKSLLDDTSLNPCDRILQLLEQAPVQEPPREGAQAGAKSFQVGVYNHGGVTGLRAATHRYPHACRILTDAVRMVCADHIFSTVALFRNIQVAPHADSRNSPVPNLIVPVTLFSGGQLFVVHQDGPDRHVCDGKEASGFSLDVAAKPWLFDAKHCKHFTLPWQGTRLVMVAFTVGLLRNLSSQDAAVVAGLGFNLPSCDMPEQGCSQPTNASLLDLRRPPGPRPDSGQSPAGLQSPVTTEEGQQLPEIRAPEVVDVSKDTRHPSTPARADAGQPLPECRAPEVGGSVSLPGDGPLLVELCAGSAVLSSVASTRGFSTLAVDHALNRHTPKSKITVLDLSLPASWSTLGYILENREVALLFAAPPCGTCSAARAIPLEDGSMGPPVLRTHEFPYGVPGLSPHNRLKVEKANALYACLAKFLLLAHKRRIPWMVENPTGSLLWILPCFAELVKLGRFSHCESCAFGGQRLKRTSFLGSDRWPGLCLRCPGDHDHAPWGQSADGSFATALEAAYPSKLCHAVCDFAEHVCRERAIPLGSAAPLVPRAYRQPRGRLHPQVIPEYQHTVSTILPASPSLDDKQCLRAALQTPRGLLPAGSKLLRSENRGGGKWFCVFGVFWDPLSFVEEARRLWHPFDSLAHLPDYLITALHEQLSLSPMDLTKLRLTRLKHWQDLAKSLRQKDATMKEQLHPDVQGILKGKHLALLAHLVDEIQWPDAHLLHELCQGFRLVGPANKSGVFRAGLVVASQDECQLMRRAPEIREGILKRLESEPMAEYAQELCDITREEADDKGWLEGPFSPDEVSDRLGEWLPVRRFAVRQGAKLRPIDDLRENEVNSCFSSVEKVTLSAMDHVLWSANILVAYFRDRGAYRFTLSTGQVLSGKVHHAWSDAGAELRMSSLDLKSAYKQLPLSPLDHNKSVVCLRNPRSMALECYIMKTLPFGGAASVPSFLRCSSLIHALGCRLGLCWSNYFDDFPVISHSLCASSTMACMVGFLKLLGFDHAKEKLLPFDVKAEVLGVQVDLTGAPKGVIQVKNKDSRVAELLPVLEAACRDKKVIPAHLPSFVGKLQYADAQIWGRAGRLALHDVRALAHTSKVPVSLDPSGLAALNLLKEHFMRGRPRTLLASRGELPFLMFTDGALEEGQAKLGLPPATIGGLLLWPGRSQRAEYFGCAVPETVLEMWRADGKSHVIGLVELYAVVVGIRTWKSYFEGRRLLTFVDNYAALDVAIKGSASVKQWRDLLLLLECPDETSPTLMWHARVPSKSNPSDGPSRGDTSLMESFNAKRVTPVCPVTQVQLRNL